MNKILFTFFVFVFDLYAKFIYYINTVKSKYFISERYIFFSIINVYCKANGLQITNQFLTNKSVKFLTKEIYCFEWVFDNIKYKQYLNDTTIQHLVPYTIHNMRYKQCINKIIFCFITDNITKEIQNVSVLLKQIAGPMQDFYKGIYHIHSQDIFGLSNNTLQITTTTKNIVFDLTKDNILEL